MKTRVLTGVAILVPAVYLLGWSPKWLFLAVMILLVERCVREYFLIFGQRGIKALPVVGYGGAAAVCVVQWAALRYSEELELILIVACAIFAACVALWRTRAPEEYAASVAASVFGLVYVAFTFSCLFPLRFSNLGRGLADGRDIVFFLFAVVCAGDIFAYFTGRLLGKHLLFPRISPKKTVEGAVGGLGASLVLGWVYARIFWQRTDTKTVLLLALAVAVAGQLGDLVESALKRGAGLKDSGALLPGHGGVLDRVDSLLFGAPVLWIVLELRYLIR
ncbi:MAG: phosphatidate cytidylyltransferase [Terriglobia bacterium]